MINTDIFLAQWIEERREKAVLRAQSHFLLNPSLYGVKRENYDSLNLNDDILSPTGGRKSRPRDHESY